MNANQLADVLLELKTAYLSDPQSAVKKYDMVTLGSGKISAVELRHSLNHVFGFRVDISHLLQLIPDVCNRLGMEIEPMKAINDPETNLADYTITF